MLFIFLIYYKGFEQGAKRREGDGSRRKIPLLSAMKKARFGVHFSMKFAFGE